jgi:hypothetical protein
MRLESEARPDEHGQMERGGIMRSAREIGRRQFVAELTLGAFAAASFPRTGEATPQREDPPNTHNMLVFGESTVFLSHLPMFGGIDKSKTAFVSPHRYQLILEAAFTDRGKDVSRIYADDRRAHPETRIYTAGPEPLVITRLFTPRETPRLSTFNAAVVRGHLEDPQSQGVAGLEQTSVKVRRVVHARMFDPQTTKPAALEYLLFGTPSELYLAHAIFAAPDFDQVLAVKVTGIDLTAKQLASDLRVTIPGRTNVVSQRLREHERVEASLRMGAPESGSETVQLEPGIQFYFEEGELLVPPTFEPTAEERKRG